MFDTANILLSLLDEPESSRVASLAERVSFRRGDVLADVDKPIDHVHFLEAGIASEIAFDRDGRSLEVACVGREGFLGIPVLLGAQHSAHRVVMETDGAGLRIPTAHFIRVAPEMPSLVSLMLKFVHVSLVQIAANALADGRYNVDQRAARWMLMCHDRTDGDDLPLTHDSLSDMLGVRRSSITNAVHFIEGETAIRASRGMVTVRDRPKLEELAGGGYRGPEREYERVMGRPMSRFP